jgi:hypothetical protein
MITKTKTCVLIDVAIPADRNVTRKEAGEKLKYKSLCEETQGMNVNFVIVPVMTGDTGIVTGGLRNNLEAILGKHSVYSLQQTAVRGTSRVIREVLQSGTEA